MVNIKTETDDDNLEILQQCQLQNEALTTQRSCPTKSSLVGNTKASPANGPNKKTVVDATNVSSPGVNASNTGQHQHPYKESKGSGKRRKLEDNEGATGLKRLQTPINLFEDECVFCHSFRTSQFHGPMVQLQYLNGRLVSSDKGNPTNTIYVHKKCMEWAPRVFYSGDTIRNMESEILRASKLRCSRCGLPGAALGCYCKRCTKSFHVPCAVMISDCRWDVDNNLVLCPEHASEALPCDEMSSPRKESESSCVPQNQCLDEQGIFAIHRREDRVDQLNTSSSSSLPQEQCSDKEGISADYQREEKQIDKPSTLRSCPSNQWVLLGSVLSASEKDSLKELASRTNATVAEEWDKNVTHVIVGQGAGIACSRSYEVLMAILSGKWVVTAGWIVDCLEELIPGPETPYEVKLFHGSHTSIDGPKKGRTGAAEGVPKLFSGLYFCLSAYMNPEDREQIQNLIAAAEGQVLEGSSLHSLRENQNKNPVKLYFVYDGSPPRKFTSSASLDLRKEMEEGIAYAVSGAQVISHLEVFNAIAAYDAQILDRKDHFTQYMCE